MYLFPGERHVQDVRGRAISEIRTTYKDVLVSREDRSLERLIELRAWVNELL